MHTNSLKKIVQLFWGYVYIDSGVFQKTHKQQQNVMLRGTGLHMTSSIATSKRKLDNNIRALSTVIWVYMNLEFT